MSKGSERIMRDKSRSLSNAGSQSSFLQRNYYSKGNRDSSQTSINGLKNLDNSSGRNFGKQRDSSATSDYSRGMGGSKISYLSNSGTARVGKQIHD